MYGSSCIICSTFLYGYKPKDSTFREKSINEERNEEKTDQI
jgi:hypothetical protein